MAPPLAGSAVAAGACTGPTHGVCCAAHHAEADLLGDDLLNAMIASWTAVLLFGGCALLRFGIVSLNAGEAAQLVTRNPDGWRTFHIVTNRIRTALAVVGFTLVQAAAARLEHRLAQLSIQNFHIGSAVCDDGSVLNHPAHRLVRKVGLNELTADIQSDILIGDIESRRAAGIQHFSQKCIDPQIGLLSVARKAIMTKPPLQIDGFANIDRRVSSAANNETVKARHNWRGRQDQLSVNI